MPLMKLKVILSPFITMNYTAKFVKTLLIALNKDLEPIFEEKAMGFPKQIRITPLMKEINGSEEVLYPKIIIKQFGQESGTPKIPPKPISIEGENYFYLGYDSSLEPEISKVLIELTKGSKVTYGAFEVRVTLSGLEVINTSVPDKFNAVKISFITPSLFRDPFSNIGDKYRRFLPYSGLVFSVNVYEIFERNFKKEVMRISANLVESHTVLNTVTKVWYYYDGDWLPGVIGYAKYFIRNSINRKDKETITKVLAKAAEMGVGTGRTAGFGFVRLNYEYNRKGT